MSTRTRTRPTPQPTITMPRVVRQRRVSRGLLGLALALSAVFALGIAALVLVVSKANPYLALARDVQLGTPLGADDLRTVYISSDPGLAPIPAAQRGTVLGRYAVTNLTAGTLLTHRSLTTEAIPGNGQQVVGVSLKAGQVPPGALKPGAHILLVAVAPAQNTTNAPPPPLPQFPATVVFMTAATTSTQLAVAVDERDAPNVARLAADGRIVVTLAGS